MSKEEKIAVIGGYDSGKSLLLKVTGRDQFTRNMGDIWDDGHPSQTDVDGESYKVVFVETGNDKYSDMRDRYIRECDGYLAVYSITDRVSFECTRLLVEHLYRIRDVDDVPIVLVGNKCDLEKKRQVSIEEGFALADSHGIPFFETSAKTRLNVNEAVAALIRRCEGKKEPESNVNDNNDDRDKKCVIQ